jgi:hypothetical protein
MPTARLRRNTEQSFNLRDALAEFAGREDEMVYAGEKRLRWH